MTDEMERPGGQPRSRRAAAGMPTELIALLAASAGLAVGTVYLPQALVPLVAADMAVTAGSAALVVTASQVGYAAGIVLVVPLGDRGAHRTLILRLVGLSVPALLLAAVASGPAVLVAASGAIGLLAVSAQVVTPLAAARTEDHRRGAVLGILLSGSIAGMLLARAGGAALGQWLGWRAVYAVTALAACVLAFVLLRGLPRTAPASRASYPALLGAPVRLLCEEPALRRSCGYQAAAFAAFSAVWGSVALLLSGPVYRLGAGAVGFLALLGAVTCLCAPLAGRLVDRRGADAVNRACLVGLVVAAGVLAAGGAGGPAGLIALGAGTLLLDVAMQCGMVANLARIHAVRTDARSRMATAYMACAYVAGGAGTAVGVGAYTVVGWAGVSLLVALLGALALASAGGPRRVATTSG